MRTIWAAVSLVALATVGAAAVVGCGGGAGAASPRRSLASSGGSLDSASTALTVPGESSSHESAATEMQVTILSGPDTGAHPAYSQSPTCSYGLAAIGEDGSDAFANQFTDDSSAGLSSLQVIVTDTRAAESSGTDRFSLTMTIGKPSKRHTYVIDTLPEQKRSAEAAGGHGTVRIDDGGSTSVVAIEGEATDGTALSLTIRCHQVLGPDGMPRG